MSDSVLKAAIRDRDTAEAQAKLLRRALKDLLKRVAAIAQVHDPETGFYKPVNANEVLVALHPGYEALLLVGFDDL